MLVVVSAVVIGVILGGEGAVGCDLYEVTDDVLSVLFQQWVEPSLLVL